MPYVSTIYRLRARVFALGAVLLLWACGQNGTSPASGLSEREIVEMLRNVDPNVCVDRGVQQTVVSVISRSAYDRMQRRGETFEFNAVSASGSDRDISEVTCNANIVASGNHSVAWKVRPALDKEGYVVSVANTRVLASALSGEVATRELRDMATRQKQATPASDMAAAPTSQAPYFGARGCSSYEDSSGNCWEGRSNASGAVLTLGGDTLYLGMSCDVRTNSGERGSWARADGGFVVRLSTGQITFPTMAPPIGTNSC